MTDAYKHNSSGFMGTWIEADPSPRSDDLWHFYVRHMVTIPFFSFAKFRTFIVLCMYAYRVRIRISYTYRVYREVAAYAVC